MNLDDYPDILTVRQAAALMQISHNNLYQKVREGSIPVIRMGKLIRILKTDILKLRGQGGGHGA